ncbi:Peroxisomal Targeting Signal 1 Protein [Pleurotus pulmonarius]
MTAPTEVTSAILQQLKSLYPPNLNCVPCVSSILGNPWYIVASVAFSASNRPDGVVSVFKFVADELAAQGASHADHQLLFRKLQDALFKAALLSGFAKTINSLIALNKAAPEDLHDTEMLRDRTTSLATLEEGGTQVFQNVYGETAEPTQSLLDHIYPDLGWFIRTIAYGLVYGHTPVLSPMETSFVIVASLIAGDTPLQMSWHLKGAQRQGASTEEARAVRAIAMESATLAGVSWRNGVPEVE